MGVGSLIRGRKNKAGQISPARFVWNYNLKDIAKAANGTLIRSEIRKVETQATEEVKPKAKHVEPKPVEIKATAPIVEQKESNNISINRNGLKVNIDLPKDISAENLTAWLSLLKDLG